MAVLLSQALDPFANDGLGRASQLGVGFLRKLNVDLNAFATTVTIVPSDIGAIKFYCVESIVPKSNHSWYVSAFSESSLTLTASANTAVGDIFIMCAGL